MTNRTLKARANKELAKICEGYSDAIPLEQIFSIVEQHMGMVVDEAGNRWEGILCGSTGHTVFEIKGFNANLIVDWFQMQSGRYELNAYVA